jgi:hypothetical protein
VADTGLADLMAVILPYRLSLDDGRP